MRWSCDELLHHDYFRGYSIRSALQESAAVANSVRRDSSVALLPSLPLLAPSNNTNGSGNLGGGGGQGVLGGGGGPGVKQMMAIHQSGGQMGGGGHKRALSQVHPFESTRPTYLPTIA